MNSAAILWLTVAGVRPYDLTLSVNRAHLDSIIEELYERAVA